MLKQIFLLQLFIFGFIGFTHAQFNEDIREAAQMYAQANLNEDYELLLDFTYPSVIEQAGGRDAYKKVLMELNEIQKRRGMRLHLFEIKEALDFVKAGDEFHALVPYRSVTLLKGGRLISENVLVAVAVEGKEKWYFVETASLTERNLGKVLPKWDNTLILPMKKAPIYKED